jgi:hypothetical protein
MISESALASYKKAKGLVIGVLKEAETSISGKFTLINIETGEDENFYLLMKNKAGFLVGRLVIYDPSLGMVKWLENELYSFTVIAPIRVPKRFRYDSNRIICCLDCGIRVKARNLRRHLDRVHGYLTL